MTKKVLALSMPLLWRKFLQCLGVKKTPIATDKCERIRTKSGKSCITYDNERTNRLQSFHSTQIFRYISIFFFNNKWTSFLPFFFSLFITRKNSSDLQFLWAQIPFFLPFQFCTLVQEGLLVFICDRYIGFSALDKIPPTWAATGKV